MGSLGASIDATVENALPSQFSYEAEFSTSTSAITRKAGKAGLAAGMSYIVAGASPLAAVFALLSYVAMWGWPS